MSIETWHKTRKPYQTVHVCVLIADGTFAYSIAERSTASKPVQPSAQDVAAVVSNYGTIFGMRN